MITGELPLFLLKGNGRLSGASCSNFAGSTKLPSKLIKLKDLQVAKKVEAALSPLPTYPSAPSAAYVYG